MNIYIIILLVTLALIAVISFFQTGKRTTGRISPLAGLAFAFVLSSLLFSEDRLTAYGLIGFGVLLALLDLFNRSRGKTKRP